MGMSASLFASTLPEVQTILQVNGMSLQQCALVKTFAFQSPAVQS